MSDAELAERLRELVKQAEDLLDVHRTEVAHTIFDDEVAYFIRGHFGANESLLIQNILAGPLILHDSQSELSRVRKQNLQKAQRHLRVLIARVERGDHRKTRSQEPTGSSGRRVFIAHSGEPPPLQRLVRFLQALGVEPVVAEWLPFRGRQVPDHARHAMDGCVAAIVFATSAETVGERKQPGRGVLTETGILQERFDDRVIYLLEEGASFGPMADGFARESFTHDNLESAFHRIVLELKAHEII